MIFLLVPHAASIASDNFKIVALVGQPIPGSSDGTSLSSFALPSIDASGQAAFRTGTSIFSREGFVLKDFANAGLALITPSGVAAPGVLDNSTFDLFFGVTQNAAGQLAFYASLAGPAIDSSNNQGIWTADAQGVRLLVRAGDPAPVGTPGVSFAPWLNENIWNGLSGSSFALSGGGRIAFQSALVGPPGSDINDRGIFVADPRAVQMIARRGQLAPGLGGAVFDTFLKSSEPPSINRHGEVAFLARLVGAGYSFSNESLWLRGVDGQLGMVIGTNQPAPNAIAGTTITELFSPRLNNAGEMTFLARINNNPSAIANAGAIYAGMPSQLTLLAIEHEPAPGANGDLFNFNTFGAIQPVINHQGHIAFNARLEGPTVKATSDTGLWSQGSDGILRLVAREGDQAPGGGVFGDFDAFHPYVLNGVGQLAFQGTVVFPGSPQRIANGIWAQDRQGALQLIARSMIGLDGPPSFPINAYDVYFGRTSGNEDGATTTFNDRGQLVFTTGSGTYLSNVAAVPEPKTSLLIAFVVLGLFLFGRHVSL